MTLEIGLRAHHLDNERSLIQTVRIMKFSHTWTRVLQFGYHTYEDLAARKRAEFDLANTRQLCMTGERQYIFEVWGNTGLDAQETVDRHALINYTHLNAPDATQVILSAEPDARCAACHLACKNKKNGAPHCFLDEGQENGDTRAIRKFRQFAETLRVDFARVEEGVLRPPGELGIQTTMGGMRKVIGYVETTMHPEFRFRR